MGAQDEEGRYSGGRATCLTMLKPKWVRRDFPWGSNPMSGGESGGARKASPLVWGDGGCPAGDVGSRVR